MQKYSRNVVPTKRVQDGGNLTVAILGARPLNRMKSMGLTPYYKNILNRDLIDIQIETVSKVFPKVEFIFVSGYKSNEIARKREGRFRIVENPNFGVTNESEDIRLVLNNMTGSELLIFNSACYFNQNTIKGLGKNSALICESLSSQNNIGINADQGLATHLNYNLPLSWCDITYIKNNFLYRLTNIVYNEDNAKLLYFEIINKLIDQNSNLEVQFPTNMNFIRFDTLENLEKYKNNT